MFSRGRPREIVLTALFKKKKKKKTKTVARILPSGFEFCCLYLSLSLSLSGKHIRRGCRRDLNQGRLLRPDVFPYLLVLYAMEHKDKQSLETIQYGEDVRHHDGLLVQVEEPECPGQT